MLLRIILALAILAGLGVIAVGHFQLRPQIEGIIQERENTKKQRDDLDKKSKKLDKDLKETKGTLETTQKKLQDTEGERDAAQAKVTQEQARSVDLQKGWDKTKQELQSVQQELVAWTGTGLTPADIKNLQAAEKKLRTDVEALKEENGIIANKLKRTQARLDDLTKGEEANPPLPAGTKGRVLVVDPKWNFVVLDIGEKEGMVPNGILTVHRNGKLVSKVKIVNVQGARSIANILPGWKLDEVMEGDAVFY